MDNTDSELFAVIAVDLAATNGKEDEIMVAFNKYAMKHGFSKVRLVAMLHHIVHLASGYRMVETGEMGLDHYNKSLELNECLCRLNGWDLSYIVSEVEKLASELDTDAQHIPL